MVVRLEQLEKVPSPISVTDEGMKTFVRLEQRINAQKSIFCTDGGMVMLVRLLHSLKASVPISVTSLSNFNMHKFLS